jgi:hypothetical protein
MNYDAMIDAIRAEDGDDPELAAATQLRLRRSLETRARGRHQLAGIATAISILLGGTVSWALATGKITALWAPTRPPVVAPEVAPQPEPQQKRRVPQKALATAPRPTLPPETVTPAPAPPPVEPQPPAPPPPRQPARVAAIAPAVVPAPVEELYRRAHELHFRGSDAAAALAAWDAYLAAEPSGRFSVEARYNRAIVMIRLGRYTAARAALAPFARGEVEPIGYRQTEAEQLVERLARYE